MKKQANAFKDIVAIQALDTEALNKEIKKTEKEIYLLTMKNRANELKQPHLIGENRRYVARLKTTLSAQ